jgi:hypothetical protein
MKRCFSLLLLVGALLGILAQEAAFASSMPLPEMAVATSSMSDECAEMMGIEKSQDKKPCQGLTLDCIAKMGCALSPITMSATTKLTDDYHVRGVAEPLPVRRLAGRSYGPEPDPPALLG